MKVTFTDLHWRKDDADVFNIHALNSIKLEGMDNGVVTFYGAAGTISLPYCNLHYGGGVSHFEFTTPHPFYTGEYINIAIFENTVCIAQCSESSVPEWHKYKARTSVLFSESSDTLNTLCNGMSEVCQYICDYNSSVDLESYFKNRYKLSNSEAKDAVGHLECLVDVIKCKI